MIESFERKKKMQAKEDISKQFMLSHLIGEHLRALFDKEVIFSKPWDYYPELYQQEKESFEKEKKEIEWEVYKEKRMAFMNEHNKRWKQKEGVSK